MTLLTKIQNILNRLKIIENDVFIIKRNWSGYLKSFLINGFLCVGTIYLECLLLRKNPEMGLGFYFLFILPALPLFLIIKDLFRASDTFDFNAEEKTIMKNGQIISSFQEISSVQISHSSSDGATYYLLKCVHHDNSDFLIEERLREQEAILIAKQLSLHLGKPLNRIVH